MDNKIYYYLDGADKKGPFTVSEIKELKLSEETLIHFEGIKNWTVLSEVPKLNTILKKEKKPIKIPSFLVLLFLAILSSGIAYYLSEETKKTDLKNLNEQIDDVFNGKDEICDFLKSGVVGELYRPKDKVNFFNNTITDNEGKEVYEIFQCEYGGWTVVSLARVNNGFTYQFNSSRNMAFKVPESTYTAGTDYGYGYSTPGYSLPTYRGSVKNAYNESMKYISVEKENKSYLAGSYSKIQTFDELSSDYHYVANVYPTKYSALSKSKSWKGVGETYVYNENWIVWYKASGKHYEIVLDKDRYYEKLGKNILIGLGISLLLFLVWKNSYRFQLNS